MVNGHAVKQEAHNFLLFRIEAQDGFDCKRPVTNGRVIGNPNVTIR
jgi:hypothetical protein